MILRCSGKLCFRSCMRYLFRCLISVALFLVVGLNGFGGIPDKPWFPKAPPLPKPLANVIQVKTVNELFQAAKDVAPGGAILAGGWALLDASLL